ncbi:MAG: hypothetical protein M1375_04805 [Candidatus Thermoplasmatota archaeon]|nr:hypothetical protein [Candidatus Thermoplasmatota archaeon]
MLIRNFLPKNYFMIKFKIPVKTDIFTLARDLSLKGMCFVENNHIIGILKKEADEKRDFLMFLSKTKVSETADYYYCSLLENVNMNGFSEMLRSPSFLVDYIVLENGYISFRISYHVKYNSMMSKMMPLFVDNGADIEYVGKYRNLRNDLDGISRDFGLKSILFRTTVPQHYIDNDRSAQVRWSRVVRVFSSKNLESVYFMEENGEPGDIFSPIDKEASIYQADTENPLLVREEEEIRKEGLKPVAAMNYFDGKNLWIQYILMERDLPEFISIYGEVMKEFPDWNGYIYEIESLEDFA